MTVTRMALERRAACVWQGALPPGAAGCWCALRVRAAGGAPWWAKIEVADEARGHIVREAFFGPERRGWRHLLLHLPAGADSAVLRLFGAGDAAPVLEAALLSRSGAALRLLCAGWRDLPRAVRGERRGLAGRLRAILGQGPARRGEAPPYAHWTGLYDQWGEAERRALAQGGGPALSIAVFVLPGPAAARARSCESLACQWLAPCHVACPAEGDRLVVAGAGWGVLLAAGDVLAPHALACFAHAASGVPEADGFTADCDEMVDGVRRNPLFKPRPDPFLLRHPMVTRGACMVRRGVLEGALVEPGDMAHRIARRLRPGRLHRIAAILTHTPPCAPPAPLPCSPPARDMAPLVSLVIPTACRTRHVLDCLRRVTAGTDYPNLEILVAFSCAGPPDRTQARWKARIGRLARVRVLDFDMPGFNYAAVNNAAVRQARGEFVLLLNDDVVPCDSGWLWRMLACTGIFAAVTRSNHGCVAQNAAADIVGARLIYGNGLVQHAGVILGLAHLCEHAFRLYDESDAGPHGIGRLDRQVSAVTGACLLVRRALYDQLDGLDPQFAVALNDVDFCLRAGAAGAVIVYAASVELYHYESLSLGRHYQGARAALEVPEVQLLRQRWAGVIAADPFYNPQAALEPGREFTPAFPPRGHMQAAIAADFAD